MKLLGLGGCAMFILLILAVNVTVGGLATRYVVDFWAPYVVHHAVHVPFWPTAVFAGLFLGEFTVPAAAVTWLLSFVL